MTPRTTRNNIINEKHRKKKYVLKLNILLIKFLTLQKCLCPFVLPSFALMIVDLLVLDDIRIVPGPGGSIPHQDTGTGGGGGESIIHVNTNTASKELSGVKKDFPMPPFSMVELIMIRFVMVILLFGVETDSFIPEP